MTTGSNSKIDAIITALGKNKKYQKESYDFAQTIDREITVITSYCSDLPMAQNFIEALAFSIDKIYSELLQLQLLLKKPTGNKIISIMRTLLGDRIHKEATLKDITNYFEQLSSGFYDINKTKKKSGIDNTKALLVALMIARNFKRFFGNIPSTAKATKIDKWLDTTVKETPYDRVCRIISEYYGIEVSEHTRNIAINKLKKLDELPSK